MSPRGAEGRLYRRVPLAKAKDKINIGGKRGCVVTAMSSWFSGNLFLSPRGNNSAGRKRSIRKGGEVEQDVREGTETNWGRGKCG